MATVDQASPSTVPDAPSETEDTRAMVTRYARKGVPYLLLAALVIYFSAKSDQFLTKDNIFSIMRSSSTLMVISAGATLIIVAGSVDLSIGGIAALAGTLCVDQAAKGHTWALWLAVPVGVACGLVNGFLVSYLKLPSFLTTLGTLFILNGIALKITAGASAPIDSKALTKLVNDSSLFGIPNITWWAVIGLAIASVIAYRTAFGRHVYAIGGNERVARLAGLPVDRDKLLLFVLSGTFAGVAGLMLIAEGGGSSPGMGDSFLLNAIAAIVMGGTALNGGSGGPARTILGVLTLAVVTNGMTLTQVDPNYQSVVFGVIVLFAVAVTVRRAPGQIVK
ncbi:MAG: ribose transport system permease protein [bacterium]